MNINFIKSTDSLRKPITTLSNPSKLLPVILLETTVTGGRAIQAYKRGGKTELRERFTEDSVSAVFWLGGTTFLNKLGDKIGERFFNIPKNFDAGSDALRTPLKNTAEAMLQKANKVINPENLKPIERKLAGFKFTKIALSTIISTAFVGFALPKINQALTRAMIRKENAQRTNHTSVSKTPNNTVTLMNLKSNLQPSPSFKGSASFANFAHNLENHAIYKLASSDAGILAGRAINARNEDERKEVIFRDVTSSFFYTISPILVRLGLTNYTKGGKIAVLNSKTAPEVLKEFSRVINENGGCVNASEFKDIMLGSLDAGKKLLIDSLPFNNDVISVDAFKSVIKDSNIVQKAVEMSGLQPAHADLGKVLTRKQVEDIFRNGAITDFGSMFRIYKAQFGEDLVNPSKFISMKQINKFRDSLTTFVEETAKYAKDGKITDDVLKTVDRKNLFKNGGFWLTGFMISALFLSTLIPKAQYWITAKRTGKNEFPGLHDKKLNQSF